MRSALGNRARRPSDGLLIKAFVVARLLGIRLLTIDATVALAPARPTTPPIPPGPGPAPTGMPARSGAVGGDLADAVRNIDEGARLLAEARRDRP
jgi:hypothetical protein